MNDFKYNYIKYFRNNLKVQRDFYRLLSIKLLILLIVMFSCSCSATYIDSGIKKEHDLNKKGYPVYRIYEINGNWLYSSRCCGIIDSVYTKHPELFEVGDIYEETFNRY